MSIFRIISSMAFKISWRDLIFINRSSALRYPNKKKSHGLVNICTTLSCRDRGTSSAITKSDLLDLIYPQYSVYTTTMIVDPANIFGGTWNHVGTTKYNSSTDDQV